MSKKIARLLKADLQESSDIKSIAAMLAGKGRGGDTILAHITPKEVSLLKEAGGAGTVNPETGLLEFYDGFDTEGFEASSYQIPQQYSYGSDYAEAQPAQVGTQDFYQPYTPVELNAPEGYAPTLSPSETSIPHTQNMVAENQPYTGQPVGYEVPKGGVQVFGAPVVTPPVRDDVAKAPVADSDSAARATPSALQKYVTDPLKALKEATGLGATDLLRVGGAGAGAIAGRQKAKQTAKQIQESVQEQKQVGQPYTKAGQELQRAAMSGELTPQGQQALQAARAQLAQGIESRGGVGVAQAQAQIEALRQNLLQNQYNLGLQVSQIGDNIALGAIRTGMQLDQQLNQANQQFYTQLAQIAGGGTYQTPRGQ